MTSMLPRRTLPAARWAGALIVVTAVHVAVGAAWLMHAPLAPAEPPAAVLIDMEPLPPEPEPPDDSPRIPPTPPRPPEPPEPPIIPKLPEIPPVELPLPPVELPPICPPLCPTDLE